MPEYQMLIGGRLVSALSRIPVINPADETVVAEAPECSVEQLDEAVASAGAAFAGWSRTAESDRRDLLLQLAEVLKKNSDEISDILIREQGKTTSLAKYEVGTACVSTLGNTAKLSLPVKVIRDDDQGRVEVHRRPLGVVASIPPWNFPMTIGITKIAAPLLAGCTVVMKPSSSTPLSMLRFGELVKDIVPKGVLNIISGKKIGEALINHPGVAKISFTGSTETGRHMMRTAARDFKRITLELGGNDAAIVLDDADPAKVAGAVFMFSFLNAGQTCMAIKRLFVQSGIYDKMVETLAAIANMMVVGPGLDPKSTFGPVQNRAQFEYVLSVLEEVKQGAGRIVCGGERVGDKGFFLKPTIVADVKEGCKLVDEETFGPILPVIRFDTVDEAVARANACPFGLGGSVWSSDWKRAAEIARRLNCGTAWVNQHSVLNPLYPFSGAKHSGIGVELGEEGLFEFTQIQTLNIAK